MTASREDSLRVCFDGFCESCRLVQFIPSAEKKREKNEGFGVERKVGMGMKRQENAI
jgi:hypothetical protein